MSGGYIPPEERARRAREATSAATAAAKASQRVWVGKVEHLLGQLRGRDTDFFLEILQPAKGLRGLHRARGKTIVAKPGWHEGPQFFISEVVDAYRIPDGIFRAWR